MRTNLVSDALASVPLRRSLSVGLALVLLVSVVAVPASMTGSILQRSAEIEDLQAEIERLRDRLDRSQSQHDPVRQPSTDLAEFVAAGSEEAAAHAQTVLRQLAETDEIRVDSIRMLAPLTEGNLTTVRASISLTMPAARVFDAINTLEAAKPPIMIDSVRVQSRPNMGSTAEGQDALPEGTRNDLTILLRIVAQTEIKLLHIQNFKYKQAN